MNFFCTKYLRSKNSGKIHNNHQKFWINVNYSATKFTQKFLFILNGFLSKIPLLTSLLTIYHLQFIFAAIFFNKIFFHELFCRFLQNVSYMYLFYLVLGVCVTGLNSKEDAIDAFLFWRKDLVKFNSLKESIRPSAHSFSRVRIMRLKVCFRDLNFWVF